MSLNPALRARLLIKHYHMLQDSFGITARQIERIVKRVHDKNWHSTHHFT